MGSKFKHRDECLILPLTDAERLDRLNKIAAELDAIDKKEADLKVMSAGYKEVIGRMEATVKTLRVEVANGIEKKVAVEVEYDYEHKQVIRRLESTREVLDTRPMTDQELQEELDLDTAPGGTDHKALFG